MLQYILGGLVLAALAAAGAMVWIRAVPVPAETYHAAPEMPAPGDHPGRGRFTAVRAVADPAAALRDLAARIEATPRTVRLAGDPGEGHVSFVTRSRVWGFPDVTNVWTAGQRIAIRGELVVGQGDLGVNRRRIEAWLDGVPALAPAE